MTSEFSDRERAEAVVRGDLDVVEAFLDAWPEDWPLPIVLTDEEEEIAYPLAIAVPAANDTALALTSEFSDRERAEAVVRGDLDVVEAQKAEREQTRRTPCHIGEDTK